MKAHVDRRGCIACGLCVATCPEVFQFEDGLSSEICPVSVISVFE